jgi:hypothetical protein
MPPPAQRKKRKTNKYGWGAIKAERELEDMAGCVKITLTHCPKEGFNIF